MVFVAITIPVYIQVMDNKIKEYRLKNGWTQKELAAKVNTVHQNVQRLEQGARKLTPKWIDKFAAVFDCTADDLLGRNHNKTAIALEANSQIESKKPKRAPYNPIYNPNHKKDAVEVFNNFIREHGISLYYNDASVVIWRIYRLLENGEAVSNTLMEMFFEDIDTHKKKN